VTPAGNPIQEAARAALTPRDVRPPWQWIEENVRIRNSPFGPRPLFDLTPWLKEPSECFADNRRHMITLQCCVQGSKSFFTHTHGIWALCQAPGPIGYYVQTNEFVKRTAEGRWLPMIEDCPDLQKLLRPGRWSTGRAEIFFQHTFAFIMAANTSNVQTISLRYVFPDDCFLYAQGLLLEAHKRATQWWNRRIVNTSTPGELGGDFDNCFEAGDKREWQLACTECGRRQTPDFEKHIKWPTNDVTKPDGQWNFDAVKRLTRFVCEFCGAGVPHIEQVARKTNRGGGYIRTNTAAPFDQVSFRWNALCLSPSAVSWGDLAVEWILACRAWKAGYQEPMKEFKTKRLALTWNPRLINPFANLPVIEIDTTSLPAKKFWPLQDFIFLSVDVQIDHFWALVMAWSRQGDECALMFKQLYNWSDVAALQAEYCVMDEDVLVDYSHRPGEVIAQCAAHGHLVKDPRGKQAWHSWKAFRGSDEFQFIYENAKRQRIALPYAWPPKVGDPTASLAADDPRRREMLVEVDLGQDRKQWLKKQCPIITWSNPSIKDIVLARFHGRVKNVKIETLKGEWNAEYFRQVGSQKKVQVAPKYGSARWKYIRMTDDHALDCRCQATVRAIQRGLIVDVASAKD
jgi:hypothetical protein